jgi:hypothetical protein
VNAAGILPINEPMAGRFWPGESAVEKRVKLGANPQRQPWIAVVGVTGDIRHVGLDTEPRPEIYRPHAVNPPSAPALLIRTRADAPRG